MNNKVVLLVVALLIVAGSLVFVKNMQSRSSLEQALTADDETKVGIDKEEEEAMYWEEWEGGDDSEQVELNEVVVTADGFSPGTLTVPAGSTVIWTNSTDATANVSSANHPTHLVYPPLNLGDFDPGRTVSLIFTDKGTFKYHDHLNPSKFGTVVVK